MQGFGDPGGAGADPRARARRARRQPDGPDLHRRPLGRLPVRRRCIAPGSPTRPSRSRADDGLRLRGAYMVAAVRCAPPANLPTPEERANCADWLEREVALLPDVHVVVCLGGFAWESALRLRAALAAARSPRPKPKFGHGVGRRRRAVAAARLLSPEPAEHVHRQAHAGDAGRGARAGEGPGLGRVRRYLDILRSPHVFALVASSLLARLPIGINALAIVLYLREQTGSFAVAGAVSGTLALGLGDRRAGPGPARRPHRRAARAAARSRSCTPSRWARSSASPSSARRPSCCSSAASSAGFAIPPTSSVLRASWTDLLEPRLHQAAYALDSTMVELIFITGPLLTAVSRR